ncbi:hypothetical protein FQN57_001586 [Myotisia sp. PD_48]|nr:hypothetical protein FQN57_001586 [Myotisia sp. PD_48]
MHPLEKNSAKGWAKSYRDVESRARPIQPRANATLNVRRWTTYLIATSAILITVICVAIIDLVRNTHAASAGRAQVARSLKEIEHVIIFMQENRSWNSYFGTMAGTRNFKDPNVQINPNGKSVFYQNVNPPVKGASTLLPYYLGHAGRNWSEAIQCTLGGSNAYQENQGAYNKGLVDEWVKYCSPRSWGYYKRQDLPIHFALAEGWTVGDMYQQSQITATNPNRVMLVSGSINVPGGPQTPEKGGTYLDNNITPGCPEPGIGCYPLKWKTIYEIYEEAGVSWQIYQDENNFDDNPLARFEQFQKAPANSPLTKKGMSFLGLDRFYKDALEGKLPKVSFIVGPMQLSEHPPYTPDDGAWLQRKIVDAVTKGPKYGQSVLMISYDDWGLEVVLTKYLESGGWGDHVAPYHSPPGTAGEWMEDYLGKFGKIFTGPGWRVPFYIISPFTRGGRVFTEHSDHTSQILFVEEWLSAKGYKNIKSPEVVHWRRDHMSNLVNALNFENPDLSIPNIPMAKEPHKDSKGEWDGAAICRSRYPEPPVPWDSQPKEFPGKDVVEEGHKECAGDLTEGRHLVFSITNSPKGSRNENDEEYFLAHDDPAEESEKEPNLSVLSRPSDDGQRYSHPGTRWIVHYYNNNATDLETRLTRQDGPFLVSNSKQTMWLGTKGRLVRSRGSAVPIDINFHPGIANGASRDDRGYSMKYSHADSNEYISIDGKGSISVKKAKPETAYLQVFIPILGLTGSGILTSFIFYVPQKLR